MRRRTITRREIEEIARRLESTYPSSNLYNRDDPLEEAIFIILSTQTDEDKYLKTWDEFRTSFPEWESAAHASVPEISAAIKSGGLSSWKACRIKNLLNQVRETRATYSLDHLSDLDNAELESSLKKLDGIGTKVARCVMMYSYGRDVFPVDVHVSRVAKRLGFKIPDVSARSRKYADALQDQVPAQLRYSLHVNLIQHGRSVCTPKKPGCDTCCLADLCRYPPTNS